MCAFLDTGRSGTALLWTGSYALPNGIELGTGSSTKTVSTTGLTTPALFKTFTSTDTTNARVVTFQSDFTSVQMSGLSLKEFAVRVSGGTVWSADGFAAVVFDGTNELQVQISWEVF